MKFLYIYFSGFCNYDFIGIFIVFTFLGKNSENFNESAKVTNEQTSRVSSFIRLKQRRCF